MLMMKRHRLFSTWFNAKETFGGERGIWLNP